MISFENNLVCGTTVAYALSTLELAFGDAALYRYELYVFTILYTFPN